MAISRQTGFDAGMNENERRKQIKRAATTVFGKVGYRKATVKDILIEAGVSRRTFYSYFKSKENVLVHLLDDFESEMRRIKEIETPEGLGSVEEVRDQLVRLAGVFTSFLLRHREIIKVLFEGLTAEDSVLAPRSENIVNIFYSFNKEYTEILQAKGFSHQSDPAITSTILTGIYLELFRRIVVKNDPTPIEKWAEEVLKLLDRAYLKR